MVLTDQGSNFLSEIFTNVCKLLKIRKIKCTAYHPQSNGALERIHRVLVEYLRCFILENQTNWDKWLPYATFMFNTMPHTATGFTPHELLFGRKPNIPGVLQKEPPDTQYTYDNYVKELQSRLQSNYQMARCNLNLQKERSKEYQDRSMNTPYLQSGIRSYYMMKRSDVADSETFTAVDRSLRNRRLDDVNITLKLPRNRTLKVHANRLKPFFG